MRTFIISEPGPVPPPLEAMPALFEAFAQWRERWRAKMEAFEFFVDGGGWGVLNTADETEVHQCLGEYPFGPFSAVQARLTLHGDEALARARQTIEQMQAAMGGANQ